MCLGLASASALDTIVMEEGGGLAPEHYGDNRARKQTWKPAYHEDF